MESKDIDEQCLEPSRIISREIIKREPDFEKLYEAYSKLVKLEKELMKYGTLLEEQNEEAGAYLAGLTYMWLGRKMERTHPLLIAKFLMLTEEARNAPKAYNDNVRGKTNPKPQ